MQTQIYLIRHGEIYNPKGIIYGRLPRFGLTKKGKEQLQKTAEFFEDKHIDVLYASPLLRARQSAKIIKNKLGLSQIHISQQIIEIKTSYQGTYESELDPLQSEVYLKPLKKTDETIEQIAERMQQFIKKITKQYAGKHTAMVSHGDPIMIIKAIAQNKELSFYSFKTNNYIQHGEVYQLIIDEKDTWKIKNVFKPQV